ncbi:MAG: hypothetical protein MZW92_04955 [Comamonadaceae bacterium]|nr:hypothetical protein [Comamonadaceae bacterium]
MRGADGRQRLVDLRALDSPALRRRPARRCSTGQLGWRTLDVFVEEPLPPRSRFWHHPPRRDRRARRAGALSKLPRPAARRAGGEETASWRGDLHHSGRRRIP